jgi:hypothetical protein
MKRLVFAVFVLNTIFSAHPSDAFYVKLIPEKEHCYAYEASRQSHERAVRVDVMYHIHSPSQGDLSCVVRSPTGQQVGSFTLNTLSSETEHHSFEAMMSGMYKVCFLLRSRADTLAMDLDFLGENDTPKVRRTHDGAAIKDTTQDYEEYEDQIERLKIRVEQTKAEMEYFTTRQTEFDKTVSSTYLRTVLFTLVNFAAMIVGGGYQVVYLRNFFRQKKLV